MRIILEEMDLITAIDQFVTTRGFQLNPVEDAIIFDVVDNKVFCTVQVSDQKKEKSEVKEPAKELVPAPLSDTQAQQEFKRLERLNQDLLTKGPSNGEIKQKSAPTIEGLGKSPTDFKDEL